ncbi:MAG: hypothetical protein AB1340_09375 [Pseudomonadota bacterium]
MHTKSFEVALRVTEPWHVVGVDFDVHKKVLTIRIDFTPGHRFTVAGLSGEHPVHDTLTKRYRHLNFFADSPLKKVRKPRGLHAIPMTLWAVDTASA